ncbi:MAG: energy transducer TonB [Novosphingobium sp.]|nr:energy transducer TonB [Novosphingobium sp.]
MSILFFAAVSLLSAPDVVPAEIEYPESALRGGKSAASLIDVVVDPNGKAVRCDILRTFGDDNLAAEVCSIQKSWKYKPAISQTGEPTFGIFRTLVKFALLGTPDGDYVDKLVTVPDISLAVTARKLPIRQSRQTLDPVQLLVAHPAITFDVAALPGIDGTYLDVTVVVEANADGIVISCESASDPSGEEKDAAYNAVACKQLNGSNVGKLAGQDDRPTGFVRLLPVRFEVPSTQ